MFEWFLDNSEILRKVVPFHSPASDLKLSAFERSLGSQLSPSHRSFLKIADGTAPLFPDGSYTQFRGFSQFGAIFSVDTVLNRLRTQMSFEPWTGEVKYPPPSDFGYFDGKPLHFLPICSNEESGGEGWCLDTRPQPDNEQVVCHYDMEASKTSILKPRYVHFEHLLMHAFVEYLLDAEFSIPGRVFDSLTENERKKLEELGNDLLKKRELWQTQLEQMTS
jgi:hypothetical protein